MSKLINGELVASCITDFRFITMGSIINAAIHLDSSAVLLELRLAKIQNARFITNES